MPFAKFYPPNISFYNQLQLYTSSQLIYIPIHILLANWFGLAHLPNFTSKFPSKNALARKDPFFLLACKILQEFCPRFLQNPTRSCRILQQDLAGMQEKRTFSCKIFQKHFYWVFPCTAGYKFSGNNFGIQDVYKHNKRIYEN